MMAFKLIMGLLVVFFLATFAIKNQQTVEVSYFFGYRYEVRLWMAILAAFVAGAAFIGAGWGISFLKERSRNWKLSRKVTKLEKELSDLKQKPLPDEPGVYPVAREPSMNMIHSEPAARALPPGPGPSAGRL